jgi:hypothetical protein
LDGHLAVFINLSAHSPPTAVAADPLKAVYDSSPHPVSVLVATFMKGAKKYEIGDHYSPAGG